MTMDMTTEMTTEEKKLPGYLLDAPKNGHIYGTLSYNRRSKCWTIKGEPCVTEMAARLFPGSQRRRGEARFTANRRIIGDVNWLMLRYPLEIAPRDRALWENALMQARDYGARKQAANGDITKMPAYNQKLEALLPVLAETAGDLPNVEIVPGDALRLDLERLIAEKFQGLTPMVCANLPYNITTPVLTKLAGIPSLTALTVLIQKEAAQRFTAPQGSPEIGAFPLQLQYRMETELLFDVEPECFLPRPKVTSTVLRCVRRQQPAVAVRDEALFQKVLKGAFLLRRKTLSNSLASALPQFSKEESQAAIAECGLPATVRGEALSLAEFAALTEALGNRS